tara:strand:+ start:406 stop:594 length:189 start_codon:yes stop_codon:yes gene_type:complete
MSKAKQLIQGLTKSEKKKWINFLGKENKGNPITISSEEDIEIAMELGLLVPRKTSNRRTSSY